MHLDASVFMPVKWDMPDGMVLILTGVSYVAEDHCINLTEYFDSTEYGSVWLLTDPIKNGERVGDYLFKLNLTIPGASLSDYIGEFTDGGGHTANPSFSAHQLMLGWHDGEKYHHVYSLPDGMTKSTVCVESFSREHMKLTVLFDPLDGPFTTNHHTQLHQPIFFTADIWATNMGPDEATRNRSCMMNVADGSKTLDEIFAE